MILSPGVVLSALYSCALLFSLSQLAVLVTSGWLVGRHQTEVVWKCASMVCGELSVMTSGQLLMPMWLADSWVILEQVSIAAIVI